MSFSKPSFGTIAALFSNFKHCLFGNDLLETLYAAKGFPSQFIPIDKILPVYIIIPHYVGRWTACSGDISGGAVITISPGLIEICPSSITLA